MIIHRGKSVADIHAIGGNRIVEIWHRGKKYWPHTTPTGFDWSTLIPGSLVHLGGPATGLVTTTATMSAAGTVFVAATFTSLDVNVVLAHTGATNATTPGISLRARGSDDLMFAWNADGTIRRQTSATAAAIPTGSLVSFRMRWQLGTTLDADWLSGTAGASLTRNIAEMTGFGTNVWQYGGGLVGTIHRIVIYNSRATDQQWNEGRLHLTENI